MDQMVEAICKEIELTTNFLPEKKLASIYFGGGTPSILNSNQLGKIIELLAKFYHWDDSCEITLEANPDDMNEIKLTSWLTLGINRISVGIQSFDDEDLQFMNRSHTAEEALNCLKLAKQVGVQELSLDLIYGSPTTSMDKWKKNIDTALIMEPQHISAYCLTVEEKTALHHMVKTKRVAAPDEKLSADQFDVLISTLDKAGYIHYEISNFGKPCHFAKHNTSYWQNKAYLGIGPSAHSYSGKLRRWNVAQNHQYMRAIESGIIPSETEILSTEDIYNEMIMTGLRTIWGVDSKRIEELGIQFLEHFKRVLRSKNITEMIVENEGIFTLSAKGKHYADRVAMEFFWTT